MAQELIRHNVLSLDFWQDTVTYAGSVMPTSTIGCAVLNIPDETIAQLDAPCMTLNLLLTGIGAKNVDRQLLPKAQEAGQTIIHALHDVQPFSRLDRKQFEDYLMQAFSEEAFTELNEYLQLPMEQQAASNITGAHPLAALLVRVIPVLGHLSYSLHQYKKTMTAFAEFLQENAEIRTPAGYAAAFGQFFQGKRDSGGKQSIMDGTDQCDSAVCPCDPSRKYAGAACQADAFCILRWDVPRRSF